MNYHDCQEPPSLAAKFGIRSGVTRPLESPVPRRTRLNASSSGDRNPTSLRCALERDFPFEQLQPVAELESWRKEVNRPIYHIHKWWANRLGSVFRAIILAGCIEPDADVWSSFYARPKAPLNRIVLDPFMGSGTTIGEALKLGCRVVGCDINPVAYFQVRKALEYCNEQLLRRAFSRVESRVAPQIRRFYRSTFQGQAAEILYAFWVMTLSCPDCGKRSRLFRKWVFSSNADPKRKPQSRALCPRCGGIVLVGHGERRATCGACMTSFDPQAGPATGQHFTCEHCRARRRIVEVVRGSGRVPDYEMYALMLLLPDGRKVYKRPDAEDHATYAASANSLAQRGSPIPPIEIPPGFNTNQARGYNYSHWHEMFNARQLHTLGLLMEAILEEPDRNARECLLLLFSGVLEFNNMFCSFKGEGTGAVRHLFSHHILKPERTPLEANPWGTAKSSGSFSTLFERRLLAAKRYCREPFEIRVVHQNGRLAGEKVYGINQPLHPKFAKHFGELADGSADALLLAGDSSRLPIPDASVDLVVTDPPYFDNVHYSELADFFYCWLQRALDGSDPAFDRPSSRSPREVQGRDADEFGVLLGDVFAECARVLKPTGTMAFTFHHSRNEAWIAVAEAIARAHLEVVAAHPVKAEMAVAVPKFQAKEPINLDLVVVCRAPDHASQRDPAQAVKGAVETARSEVARFNACGVRLSRGDVRVVLMGGFLHVHSEYCHIDSPSRPSARDLVEQMVRHLEDIYTGQIISAKPEPDTTPPNHLFVEVAGAPNHR